MTAIVTERLTKEFDSTFAVQDVTLEVPEGIKFAFVGPSGCGKTTLIRLLTGYYRPTHGQVRVLGCSPEEFTEEVRKKIGYMPQLFSLFPDLTVHENLNFSASLYGMGPFRRKRFNALLDFVELREQSHQLASELSGGMQRRLALAATLVHKPELIFLDEPTAGIDPLLRRKFWDYFGEIHKEEVRTLFITTQYVSEAGYCDLVGLMSEGRLLAVDTPSGLKKRAFGGDLVDLITEAKIRPGHLPLVKGTLEKPDGPGYRLVVDNVSQDVPVIERWLKEHGILFQSLQPYEAPLDDAFIELVKEHRDNE